MAFHRLYYHLVWATKNREPLITSEMEPRLQAYLVRKAAEVGVYVYAVNNWHDHVHMIVSIPPKHSVADVVKRLKGTSSHYLNHDGGLDFQFAWQRGYGALSLGERQRSDAETYVHNQKQHHAQQATNSWLEHCAEFDEGPEDTGLQLERVPQMVQEERASYDAFGEFPF